VRFILLPGHRYDTVGVAPLIRGLRFDALLADKAFDSNWIIDALNDRGALICISQRPSARSRWKSTNTCTGGATWSRISFANSRSSNGSPGAATRPTQASPQ